MQGPWGSEAGLGLHAGGGDRGARGAAGAGRFQAGQWLLAVKRVVGLWPVGAQDSREPGRQERRGQCPEDRMMMLMGRLTWLPHASYHSMTGAWSLQQCSPEKHQVRKEKAAAQRRGLEGSGRQENPQPRVPGVGQLSHGPGGVSASLTLGGSQ